MLSAKHVFGEKTVERLFDVKGFVGERDAVAAVDARAIEVDAFDVVAEDFPGVRADACWPFARVWRQCLWIYSRVQEGVEGFLTGSRVCRAGGSNLWLD